MQISHKHIQDEYSQMIMFPERGYVKSKIFIQASQKSPED